MSSRPALALLLTLLPLGGCDRLLALGGPMEDDRRELGVLDRAGQNLEDPSASTCLCPVDPALEACYTFDAGLPDDGSGHGYGLNLTNAIAGSGYQGNGLHLTGSNSYGELVGGPHLAGEATIELWFRLDKLPPPGVSAGLIDRDGEWGLLVTTSAVICAMGNSFFSFVRPATTGSWSHLACVRRSGFVEQWVDGTLVTSSAAPPGSHVSTNVIFGADADFGPTGPSIGRFLSGCIDSVRLWSRARTAQEIAATAKGGCP